VPPLNCCACKAHWWPRNKAAGLSDLPKVHTNTVEKMKNTHHIFAAHELVFFPLVFLNLLS
jgi:hypothetical protein